MSRPARMPRSIRLTQLADTVRAENSVHSVPWAERRAADLAQPAIRQYLRSARKYATATEPWPAGLKGVTTVVKAIYARKRRPAPARRTARVVK